MATGGNYPFRSGATEPRTRGGWQRSTSTSDKDDNVSLNSLPNELRPNNWPSAPLDNMRRRKKGNPEREREQSLTLDSPPPSERNQRTPSTYPRTRITPFTPTSQRIALEKLRQQLTFSDLDDGSNDGEKNNERNIPSRRGNLPNFMRQDMSRSAEVPTRGRPDVQPRSQSLFTNNAREDRANIDVPDSGQIVGRLMQIREYIKQANTMMESLKKTGTPQANREEVAKLRTLIENLQEQERAYLGLLQELLSFKGDLSAVNGLGNPEELSRPESRDETQSVDIDVQSETSEATLDNLEDKLSNCLNQGRTSAGSQPRPRIEDKLGLSEEEEEESSPENMEDTLVQTMEASAMQEYDYELNDNLNEDMEGDDDDELRALRQQQQLLKRLHEQQEQMRALKGRQAALLALQKDAEQKLAEARRRDNQALAAAAASASSTSNNTVLRANIMPSPQPDNDVPSRSDPASDGMPRELQDMRQHLSYLRNELKEQNTDANERQSNPEVEAISGLAALDDNRRQLQDKLKELQDKKQKMDSLLHELNSLRQERQDVLTRMNNGAQLPDEDLQQMSRGAEGGPPVPNNPRQAVSQQGQEALSEADNAMVEAEELRNIIDAREKMRKLQEVKERLNQLRSLVQYYQNSAEQGVVPDVDERTAFQNMIEEYNQGLNPQRPMVSESGRLSPLGATGGGTIPRPAQIPQKSDEDNRSDSDSSAESESNLSSLGPWGDDPEIQAKVRKLKAAKEKLKQLQNIVSMVQRSPDAADSLPDNLVDIANSLEDGESQVEDKNVSASEGEVPITQAERDSYYEAKMQEQIQELDQLKEERRRLLAIQQELQSLHDRFGKPEEEDEVPSVTHGQQDRQTGGSRPSTGPPIQSEGDGQEEVSIEPSLPVQNNDRPARPGVPVVTFSSNDEVYGKMRKQRMLREELRQKKRELEAIMKKDTSRKQYGKNQDNQSDTVSYTTAEAGAPASVDATMATWGGSTVDNLESITEDEDGQQITNEMEEDDAYPSDGIVQVEEEEEENDSDNETYTIEDDVRQRRLDRSKRGARPEKGGARPKQKQTYPRSKAQSKGSDILQQQLQQQQMMLGLNQCIQQMAMQQMEIQNMQRQMQCLTSQMYETEMPLPSPFSPLPDTLRLRSTSSILPPDSDARRFSTNAPSSSNRPYMFTSASRGGTADTLLRTGREDEYSRNSSRERDGERSNNVVSSSSRDQHKIAVKKKASSLGRGEATMKRKTSSLSERSKKSTSKQRQDRSSDNIPSLNLEQSRKKRLNSQNNWSTGSMASSSRVEPGLEGPDVVKVSRGSASLSQRLGVGDGVYRPGLSAGISGAGFLENSSQASTISTREQQGATGGQREEIENNRESDDPGDLSLFEALRESIYSEVATLISQNENRPHFLIEIFRELQLLTTDYLRQRVLYSIKDIVSKYLTEQTVPSKPNNPMPAWINTTALNNCTTSELTPSESLLTSDDEEIKVKVREIQMSVGQGRGLARGQSLQNDMFDYEENADNDSSLSTPSNSVWENPFAQDSLGDTAIHLDKALQRMKEYDQKIAEEDARAEALAYQREKQRKDNDQNNQDPTSSSAVDQGSESSMSSVSVSGQQYPKIDTQQLDQQIKTIMSEVIPVIKEHMDQVCSSQLLAYIKRLVLSLTQQYDSSQYSRFFHNQLSSALQDSLSKFEGRKMRQCGEDLLVDMSEVLFNELAFFRLMEGLGEPPANTEAYCTAATQTQDEDDVSEGMGDDRYEQTEESDTTETTSTVGDDEAINNSVKVNATEEEELGKMRDDELANDTKVRDDEKDEDCESPYKASPVQIELAPSETKPFTRIGSDEDDEDADETQSADDPSETAVSRDAMMERSLDMDNGTMPEDELSYGESNAEDADQGAQSSANTSLSTPRAEGEGHKQATPHINGEVVENGEVTIDDLPPTLNVVAASIQSKMSEEQQSNSSMNAVLDSMPNHEELAGDGQFLKEP
ncbi:hypothetical protein FSP39_017062 [Pinctada imbricata]|uniref:Pericentriolar material 1 protein C-terminal domain-containing protein n=1 Tax=Pinctada imbricata TaxID=66713 RepID=A0AA88YEQ9_PINIB|nr:hypothetical protein FSP39_017062 [Pinctada imbricata]